jgi:hypothetical protein
LLTNDTANRAIINKAKLLKAGSKTNAFTNLLKSEKTKNITLEALKVNTVTLKQETPTSPETISLFLLSKQVGVDGTGRVYQANNKGVFSESKVENNFSVKVGTAFTPTGTTVETIPVANTVIPGPFLITRNEYNQTFAKDEKTGAIYMLESTGFALKTFTPVTPNNIVTEDIILGTTAWPLYNPVRIDANTIKDAFGTYTKNAEGSWSASFVGGFKNVNNPQARYQANPISNPETRNSSRFVAPEVLEKIVAFLNKKLKVQARILTASEIKDIYGAEAAASSGFNSGTEIIINSSTATLDTVMHELFGHTYMDHLKTADPELYNSLLSQARLDPIFQEIKNNPRYSSLSEEQMAEEAFVTLLGLETQDVMSLVPLNIWQKIRNFAEGFLNYIKEIFGSMFGIKVETEISVNDSLQTVFEKIGKDVVLGSGSILHNLTHENRGALAEALTLKISFTAALELLESRGYIQKTCY